MKQYMDFAVTGEPVYVRDCGWEACAPGHSWGPAVRDYYLIHCIRSGRGVFFDEGRKFTLSAGQGFLIVPGAVTVYRADQQAPWEYRWVGFAGTGAQKLLRAAGLSRENPVFTLPEGERAKAEATLQGIYEDSAALRLREVAAVGGLYRFMALIGQQQPGEAAGDGYFDRAMWFLRGAFSRGVKVTDAADFVGLSRSQLFRVFKAACGKSPQQVLADLRLDHAEALLREDSLSLEQVARSCGFADAARMGDAFRRCRGVRPTELRKKTPHG